MGQGATSPSLYEPNQPWDPKQAILCSVESDRSPFLWGAKKALRDQSTEYCLLLTWARPCQNPIASSSEGWRSCPPGTKCVDSEYRECPPQLPPPRCLQPRDCLLTKTAPAEISGTCFSDPALLYKPCPLVPVSNNPFFLFQLYVVTQPLCSTLYNKHTGLPEG